MKKINLALMQAKPLSDITHKGNLNHALELLKSLKGSNVDIACFPEYYPFTGEEELREAAKSLNIFLIAGLAYREAGRLFNTATLIDNSGKVIGRQKKANLGLLEIKHFGFTPGERQYHVFETDLGRVGLGVCVDFWGTSEAAMEFRKKEADLIFHPSFLFIFQKLWRSTVITRAVDHLLPIIAVDMARFEFKAHKLTYPNACGAGSFVVDIPPWENISDFSRWWQESPDPYDWCRIESSGEEKIIFETVSIGKNQEFIKEWSYRLGLREKIEGSRSQDYKRLSGLEII